MTCPRFGKLIAGCKFVPRYTNIPPTPKQMAAVAQPVFASDVEALMTWKYEGDVCVRCGKSSNNKPLPEGQDHG